MNNKTSLIGQSVGRYSINEIIGKGANGEVYKGFDNRLLRSVAIKVSSPKTLKKGESRKQIIREAQIVARVEHANIIPIYDVIDHEKSVFIVMRFLNGEDLNQHMHRAGKPFDEAEATKIITQVMIGINFAHNKGVVHSDLKPANIFISNSNEVIILDFGLAAILELEKKEKGKIYGTPLYMSPEQINGVYFDARSDIYSLGVILYKLITGHHPFEDIQSMQELLSQQMDKVPDPPHKINTAISKKYSDSVMRALEKNPGKRYGSCREFLIKLGGALPKIALTEYADNEMRWDNRVNVNLQAKLQLKNTNEIILANIINLSVSGLSILVPLPLEIGSIVKIEFDILEYENDINMSGKSTVLWNCRRTDTPLHEVGMQFNDLDDMDKKYLGLYIRNLLLS